MEGITAVIMYMYNIGMNTCIMFVYFKKIQESLKLREV